MIDILQYAAEMLFWLIITLVLLGILIVAAAFTLEATDNWPDDTEERAGKRRKGKGAVDPWGE